MNAVDEARWKTHFEGEVAKLQATAKAADEIRKAERAISLAGVGLVEELAGLRESTRALLAKADAVLGPFLDSAPRRLHVAQRGEGVN